MSKSSFSADDPVRKEDRPFRKGIGTEVKGDDCHKRGLFSRSWDSALLFPGLVYCLILLYVVLFAWLSILRHETFQSNAMDLGYTDQVVWNTLHGRFMRFSTFENAPIDLPLAQFRRTDTLLAYHAELLLAPISLFYLIYDSPVTLLILQTVVIGLGALPAFWLARDHLGSGFAGLVFAAAYLLAPAVEGANLSDFHAVSLTASLLLFAFYFYQARRYGLYFLLIALAMIAKEDVPLLLVMIGLYIFIYRKERKVGALTTLMGIGWFLICTQVILPYHNGLPSSPFYHRITVFGPTIAASLLNIAREPVLLVQWLGRPEILTYLGGLLASTGFMSLFSPVLLTLSAPVVAMNVFSTWSWTYSEGAHYSASIIPFLTVSGIGGLGFLARQLSERWRVPRGWAVQGLAALVLVASGYHHYRIGISPLARSYHPPRMTSHHRLARELMALIPPDASLSTQSGLYPHLAHREKAYFFPAVNDAEYVFLDVTGSSYPITTVEVYETVQRLLSSGEYGVLAAQDGYLLLEKGLPADGETRLPADGETRLPADGETRLPADGETRLPVNSETRLPSGGEARLPEAFYTFARTDERAIPHALRARFGDALELLGYDYRLDHVVHAHQLPATVTTYWRPLKPLAEDHVFAFFFSRQDGAIVYHYDGPTPTTTWYPAHLWQEGEVIRIETPVLSVGRLQGAMAAVVLSPADPWSVGGRLGPIERAGDQPLEVYEARTLLKLFDFQ